MYVSLPNTRKNVVNFFCGEFFVFQYFFFTFCPTLNLKIKSLVNTMFRHWSLKESYVKAVGTGLNLDLRTIEFKLLSNPEPGSCIFDTQVSGNNSSHQFWSCIWSWKLMILILYLEPETFGLIQSRLPDLDICVGISNFTQNMLNLLLLNINNFSLIER